MSQRYTKPVGMFGGRSGNYTRSPSPFAILTVTNSGGFALYTTAAPHGRAVNDYIDVSVTSLAQYNALTQQVTAVTATTIKTDKLYTADATGGVWAIGQPP